VAEVDAVPKERATVLVCDDEEVLRELILASLADRYSIVEAEDGEEALRLVRERRPELVLLDMMMPGLSGIDVLARLRADPTVAATPVVMLTARTQLADRESASAAGADRFLAKPFSPAELRAVVAELLEEGR
jgi:CheY-like chemotaxis protein